MKKDRTKITGTCPFCEAMKLIGQEPIRKIHYPLKDENGLPLDKQLVVKEGGKLHHIIEKALREPPDQQKKE